MSLRQSSLEASILRDLYGKSFVITAVLTTDAHALAPRVMGDSHAEQSYSALIRVIALADGEKNYALRSPARLISTDAAIKEFGLPWHCNRLGARGEYIFAPKAPRTGKEAADGGDFELEQYIHLRLLNDGFLLTPFHNMALMSPATTAADVDAHTAIFDRICADLVAG